VRSNDLPIGGPGADGTVDRRRSAAPKSDETVDQASASGSSAGCLGGLTVTHSRRIAAS